MKFTKFIPLVCAMALTVPAFADPPAAVTLYEDYTIEVPTYFSITETSATTDSGTVTIGTDAKGDVTGLTWNNTMGASYHVVSNAPTKTFYIKATCPVTGTPQAFSGSVSSTSAGDDATTVIAFANVDAATAPTSSQIDDAVSASPTAANNPNVIAATFTRKAVTQTVGTCSSVAMTNRELVYTITPGTFEVPFQIGTSAAAKTFSTHDEAGTYQATITITDAAS